MTRGSDPGDLLPRVRRAVARHGLLARGDRVVVALSGGADSTALLDLLARLAPEYDLELIPAHLDHGLRPGAGETAFCREAAARYGLELVAGAVRPGRLAGPSLQQAAREARYAFLLETARAHGARRMALGHQADDQAETVLLRLLRGAGRRGLAGMPVRREPGVIRPLLGIRRAEIRAYLRRREIPFLEDPSNRSEAYLRNRVRADLLPRLEREYNPSLVRDLAAAAEILAEEDLFLEEEAARRGPAEPVPGGVALDAAALRSMPRALARRAVRQAVERAAGDLRGLERVHVEAVLDLLAAPTIPARVALPRGLEARKVYDRLEVGRPRAAARLDGPRPLAVPGRTVFPELGVAVECTLLAGPAPDRPLPPDQALVDLERCASPLAVRSRRAGDVFRPEGMDGRKKVARYLADRKVPCSERDRVPLVVDGLDRVVWVAGYRRDARFAAGPGSVRVARLRLQRAGEGEP